MRAAVLVAPGRFEVVARPVPEPGPGEVRVRLEGSGVCGSNLPPWEGRPWFQYPFAPGAPGHEGWGTVDRPGEGVTALRSGDRVAILSSGAFAEYDCVPSSSAVSLPAGLEGAPFPGEPLACAVNVFRRAEIARGQVVAVVGVGFLGALVTRLAAHAGAHVIAIARRACARDAAARAGAAAVLPFEDRARTVAAVRALSGGALCDRVVECTGAQAPLDLAGELTRERGRLVIAGYHQDGPRSVDLQMWNWRGLDVINAHERDAAVYLEGLRYAVDLVASGVLDPAPLFTHVYRLDGIGRAFEALSARAEGFMKALVLP